MRKIIFLCLLLSFGCDKKTPDNRDNNGLRTDTVISQVPSEKKSAKPAYSNERFRNVTVENSGKNKFTLTGEAQIFEAAFSWVIEDGHNELKNGHQMTSVGAPEWGKFNFDVEIEKPTNGELTIILFETSAKDGSRQYELPIPLPD